MTNKIINLDILPSHARSFVDLVIDQCNEHGVKLTLSSNTNVKYLETESEAAGYFCEDPLELKCGCGGDIKEWIAVLVHETCHMDQFLEHDPLWEAVKVYNETDAVELLDLWLEHKIELNNSQITTYINAIRNLELDCERRSIKKIIDLGLSVDTVEYIKRANGHALFYNILPLVRNWGKMEEAQDETFWTLMPYDFKDDGFYQLKDLDQINEWIWEEPYIHFRDLFVSAKTVKRK